MSRPDGEPHGISDGGPPVDFSEEDLSRVLDALDTLEKFEHPDPAIGTYAKFLFRNLPMKLKMDFNWTKWSYRAVR